MNCYRVSTRRVVWYCLAFDLATAIGKAGEQAALLGVTEPVQVQDWCSGNLAAIFRSEAWDGLNVLDRVEACLTEALRQQRDVKRLTEYAEITELMS